jgi:hypothetical protein
MWNTSWLFRRRHPGAGLHEKKNPRRLPRGGGWTGYTGPDPLQRGLAYDAYDHYYGAAG